MKRSLLIKLAIVLGLFMLAGTVAGVYFYNQLYPTTNYGLRTQPTFDFSTLTQNAKNNTEEVDSLPPPPSSFDLDLPTHYYQTFNNCGPATLAMILNYYGEGMTQQSLGTKLRPYQNPQGDNDDKTVFLSEMAQEANVHGYKVYHRPNGDIQKLKYFTSNGIPVIAKTWLVPEDDIGHYRIVTGYNDDVGYIIQDDSYQGPNRRFNYENFLELWQPFNYQYLIVVEENKAEIVEQILGREVDVVTSWKNALLQAQHEESLQPENPYPIFNQSIAHYYLDNFDQSLALFELVENTLPGRMLWYQLEPIDSYIKTGKYDRAFELIDKILANKNRAYAELYVLRGEIYAQQGNNKNAKQEFETALKYNSNLQSAKDALTAYE